MAGRVAYGVVPGRGVGAPGVYSTVRRGGIHGAVVQVAAHVRLGLGEGISGIMTSFSQIFLHSQVSRGWRGAMRTDSFFGPGVKGSIVCRGKAGRVADGGVPGRGVVDRPANFRSCS